MLLDGSIEKTFHSSVFPHTRFNITIEAVLSSEPSGFEPLHIFWIAEHVLHSGKALVHSHWVSSEDDSLDDDTISIRTNHGTNGNKFLLTLVVAENKHRAMRVGDGTKNAGRKESSSLRQETLKLVLVTVETQMCAEKFSRSIAQRHFLDTICDDRGRWEILVQLDHPVKYANFI